MVNMYKFNFLITTLALSLLQSSCSSLDKSTATQDSPFFPEKSAPVSAKPLAAMPVTDFEASAARIKMERSFNVSVHEIDAREFYMGLVVDSDENIIVHPEVTGLISLQLKNVNVSQVLDAVQKVYGYDYKKTDIGYVIYPATLQVRTFKIDRLDLLRAGKSSTYVTSGQIANTSGVAGGQQGNQQGGQQQGNQQLGNQQQSGNNQSNNGMQARSSGSFVTTTMETDFWKELNEALQALIAVDKDASIVINRQSGVVIARAKSMQLHEIESFLATTQSQISRQVILEAKILEVTLNSSHQDGVEWKSIVREGLQAAATSGVYTLVSNAGSFVAGDFTAVVSLLESQGKTNVLSSPRISTLNNQPAIIKVGQDETFVTGISAGISGGINSGTTRPTPILTPYFSGIALDVTPQINDSGDITLHVHPSITKVVSQDVTYTIDGLGSSSVVPTALNTIRESDSIVKAQNGQIIVLGGLMQDLGDENKEGVYGLSRIPYLGNLFRVNSGKSQKTELVILLKATLISSEADWTRDKNVSQQRVKVMDSKPLWK